MPSKPSKKVHTPKVDFELLFTSTPDLYLVLNPNFDIVAASNSYLAATMTQRDQVLGKNIFEIFPDNPNEPSTGSANLRASLERVKYKKVADAMAVQKYDIRSPRTGDFEERFWSPINSPILDKGELVYILHRAEDVTEFLRLKEQDTVLSRLTEQQRAHLQIMERDIVRRAQEIQETNTQLRESEERLRLLIEGTKDYAILILDPDGNVKTWNAGAERIKGYKAEDIIGRHFSVFFTQEARDLDYPNHILKKAREFGRHEEEGWRLRKDGTRYLANAIITPIYDESAHLVGYGKVIRDLTENKKVDRLKNEFVSVVSHELRTPLTSIRGSLSLVLGGAAGEISDKSRNLLNIANANSERLVKLINDILDIEKIEAGKMDFKFRTYDIARLIKEALVINEMYAQKYSVRLVAPTLYDNILVKIDTDRLMQVLTNLISNAVKFSPVNGEVKIGMDILGDRIRVSVVDKGEGIPFDFQNKIFQKFSQADASTTRQEGGTGLGLAISQAIIEKMHGVLNFETHLGKGTTFYFDLPIVIDRVVSGEMESTPDREDKYVLVCEDDREQALFIQTLLKDSGYKVDVSFTGAQAKELLSQRNYEALLLDLILPDMSGIQVIKELRSVERNNVPIIVISAIASQGKTLLNGSAVEVLDWLEKPIDFNKLVKAFSLIKNKSQQLSPTILHVEDEPDVQEMVKTLLKDRSNIKSVSNLQQAKDELIGLKYDLVILDLFLPDGSGVELLPMIADSKTPVIIFSNGDLDPKYAHYINQYLNKARATPQELVDSILNLIKK